MEILNETIERKLLRLAATEIIIENPSDQITTENFEWRLKNLLSFKVKVEKVSDSEFNIFYDNEGEIKNISLSVTKIIWKQ